jgi:hypothetical protein
VCLSMAEIEPFPNPFDHSAFNGGGGGGGGPECSLNIAHRSTVEKKARKSMAHGVFRTPPTDLFLMEGGGGSGMECFLAGPFHLRCRNPLGQTPTASQWSDIPCHPMMSFSTFLP